MVVGKSAAPIKLPDYPVVAAIAPLRSALKSAGSAVLCAPPGSGKTTVVPLALMDEDWLAGGRILILEPRRVAARASATRMAHLCGEKAGMRVGFQIRFERKVSEQTRIEVITEGLLTRRLQADPELPGVGLIIFDEFHERSLDADLALALALDARTHLNPALRILVMSATLDAQRVAGLLGDAPIIEAGGRMFPVDCHYLPQARDARLDQGIAQAAQRALKESEGDALVFLPGAGEIRSAQRLLEKTLPDVAVRPLYGDLPSSEQDLALAPDARQRRKIILATNIAQTSLTVEGVTSVIDSGLVRVARFDLGAGANRLETLRVSRASADQRAGRAGRLAPGVVYRLWSQDQQGTLAAHDTPEILAADVSRLALELAAWGVADPAELGWLDLPGKAQWDYARQLLLQLGAIDERGKILAHGKALAKLPATPRLAQLLITAGQLGAAAAGAWLAAALEQRAEGDEVDLLEHVSKLAMGRTPASRRAADSAAQFLRLLGTKPQSLPVNFAEHVPALVLQAFPERLAQRREGLREQAVGAKQLARREVREVAYQCADGGEARLPEHSAMARHDWLAVAHWVPDARRRIQLAVSIDESVLRDSCADRIQTHREVSWDAQQQHVIAQEQERIGRIVLSARRISDVGEEGIAAMLVGIRSLGLSCLPWTPASRQWQARVLCLGQWQADQDWPDVSDEALMDTLEHWLAPWLDGVRRRSHLDALNLPAILESMLSYEQQQALAKLAPTHLEAPSGQRHGLQYTPGLPPKLEVKLQEMLGSSETPTVCGGKIRISLHLLSPARRPVAITDDLAGFWQRAYLEVRKDLRGRYPKHPWPEDPRNAVPTHRAKPRGT